MTRTQVLQEIRRMRFAEAGGGWRERRLSQEEAARLLGVCERTFRRYVDRYEDEGLDGLVEKRSGARSRHPPVVPSSVGRQVEEKPALSGPPASGEPGRPGTQGRPREAAGRPSRGDPQRCDPVTRALPGRCGRRLPACGDSSPGLSEKPPIHCQSMSYTKTYTLSVGQRPISRQSGRTSPGADI